MYPLEIRGFAFHVEAASFGYARIRSSAGDARKLMTDAALAMHQSQHNPAVTWTQYTKALEHQTRETVDMTKKLRQALGADQLELYYQPQVDLASGRIIAAAEALLRWNHPQAGFIPPGQFIALAEHRASSLGLSGTGCYAKRAGISGPGVTPGSRSVRYRSIYP